MSTIEVKKNNSITNDPCALCGTRCDPEGVDPFLAGTWRLVCDQCAQPEVGQELYAKRQELLEKELHNNSHHYFGTCPECGDNDGYRNAGKSHWFLCHEHRVRWCVGSNLFSSWRHETEEQQRHAYEVDPGWGHYAKVAEA